MNISLQGIRNQTPETEFYKGCSRSRDHNSPQHSAKADWTYCKKLSSITFLKDSNKVTVSACPFLSAFNSYQYKRQIFYCSINLLYINKNYFKEFHTLNVTQLRILFRNNFFVTFTALHFQLRIRVTRDNIFTWILYIRIQHTLL